MNSIHSALVLVPAAAVLALASRPSPSQTTVPTSVGAEPSSRRLLALDFDVNGLPDLLVVRGGRAVLLENRGGGVFEDATERAGLSTVARIHGFVTGATTIDVDGDGLEDLFLWGAGGEGALLRNDGTNGFTDVSEAVVTDLDAFVGVVGAEARDLDGDGFDDLLLERRAGPVLLRTVAGRLEPIALPELPIESGLLVGTGGVIVDETSDAAPDAVPAPSDASPRSSGGGAIGPRIPLDISLFAANGPGGASSPLSSPSISYDPSLLAAAGGCAVTVRDVATAGCLKANSTPTLGQLYPLSSSFFVDTTGKVGLGTVNPAAQLGVGQYFGGQGTSAVSTYAKQVALAGNWNAGYNGGKSVKLWIGEYDNDPAATDIYPIYCEDENNGVDFYVRNDTGVTSAYLNGAVGVNTPPSQSFTFRAINDGSHSLSAGRFETWAVANTEPSLLAVHNGNGAGISGLSFQKTGVEGAGVTGMKGVGRAGGWGVIAENADGVGLLVNAIDQSTTLPGAQIIYEGSGAALKISTGDPTNPLGAEIEGDINLGVQTLLGGFDDRLRMRVNAVGNSEVRLHNFADTNTLVLQASETDTGGGSRILLRDDSGATTLILDADYSGHSRVISDVVEIKGGADLVESFVATGEALEPGTVVVANVERPGEILTSSSSYDTTVLGVVSGAGGVAPGLHLAQEGVLDGDTRVALSGRVYVKASTENGAIRAGDMLTTAELAGHAMRATDRERAFGSIIGKALSALDDGTGLVLVLVGLQ